MASDVPTVRIDAHVHLSRWWPDVARTGYRPDLDYTVTGLLQEMDAAGIERAVVIQLFQAPSEREALAEGRELERAGAGRLLPVGTVDPTRGPASVRRTIAAMELETTLVGIKLFPGYRSFYPHDRRLEPVYEFAARRRLPVLVHQGDTLDGLGLLKFARPVELDEVATRYRDVRFVLCHLGNPWIDEAAELVYKNPNLYTDCSGLLPPPSSPFFGRAFRAAQARLDSALVATGLPGRFLLGSDWPLESFGAAVALVEGIDLSEEDRAGVLGGNAERLFGSAVAAVRAKAKLPPSRPPARPAPSVGRRNRGSSRAAGDGPRRDGGAHRV